VMLGIYSVLSIGFWVWFVWKIVPALVVEAAHAAQVITTLIAELITRPAWPGGARLEEGVTAAYVFLLAALIGWQLLRTLIRLVPTAAVPHPPGTQGGRV